MIICSNRHEVRSGQTRELWFLDGFGPDQPETRDTLPALNSPPIHPKAMPVILTKPDEVETWMTAPADEALKLQRPLPD
jgi:hypothetical protein